MAIVTEEKSGMNGLCNSRFWPDIRLRIIATLCCIPMMCTDVFAERGGGEEGKISFNDSPRIHKLSLPALAENDIGWEIILRIEDPRAVDVDLEVFANDPKGRFIEPVCTSDELGATERCRVHADEFPDRRAWIRVFPAEGTGSTRYSFQATPLMGPAIEGTDLYGSDAIKAPLLPDTVIQSAFGFDSPVSRHLYRIAIPPDRRMQRLSVWVRAKDGETPLQMAIFDSKGNHIKSTVKRASEQILTFDTGEAMEYYALVQLETLRSIAKRQVVYDVEVRGEKEGLDLRVALEKAQHIGPRNDPVYIYDPEMYFFFQPWDDDISFLILEGEGFDLSLFPDPYDEYEKGNKEQINIRTMGNKAQFAVFGEPIEGSEHVMSRMSENRSFLVQVKQREGVSFGKARLVVKSSQESDLMPWALIFSAEQPDKELSLPLKRKTHSGKIEPGKLFVYKLDPGAARFFQANLDESEGLSALFDIALCGQYGEVFDVGDRTVTFDRNMIESLDPLFLVIFPWPPDRAEEGGDFRLVFENISLYEKEESIRQLMKR